MWPLCAGGLGEKKEMSWRWACRSVTDDRVANHVQKQARVVANVLKLRRRLRSVRDSSECCGVASQAAGGRDDVVLNTITTLGAGHNTV